MATLTAQGLTINRYPEILQIIKDGILENISAEISFDEDLIITQIVQVIANEMATMEEMLQALNDARDRDKAEGTALDDLLWLIGLKRISSGRSAGIVTFETRDEVTIPSGTVLSNPSSGDRFRTTSSVLATPRACQAVWYEIEVANERTYTVNVEGTDFSYTSDTDATVEEIIAGLVVEINDAGSDKYTAGSDSPTGTPYLYIYADTTSDIDTSVTQYMSAKRIRINVPAEAQVVGPVRAPSGTVTNLITGIGGVFSLINQDAFGVGRFRETDAEFRARAASSLSVSGSSTYSAIFTALSNLSEVTEVVLLENSTNTIDGDGLPPHSFEAIVNIPDTSENDQLVAETLWNEKPIGIQTHGTVNGGAGVDYVDTLGQTRVLKFSRPEDLYIAIRVTYSLYDEETPPEFLSDLIRAAVINYGSSLSSGVDVIPRRFIGPIYTATGSGLGNVTVEAQTLATIDGTPVELDWSEDVISVAPRETAAFVSSNVYIVESV